MIAHQNPAPQKPDRVVLLGARGFIGKAICRQLEIQGIRNLPLGSADLNLLETAAADQLAAMLEPDDAVIMLAALTPDRGRDIATLIRNLVMMQNTCKAIEKTGCAHLIYFSSDAVYSGTAALVSEDIPPSPQDLYGVMHYAREIMARSIAGAQVLTLRPTLIYGLDDTHNSYGPNRFRRSAQKEGKITLFGGGEETRDHIHVDDVANLTVRCLVHRSVGTLNASTGISTSFHDVAKMVAKQFNQKVEIVTTPRATPVTHRHYDVTSLIKAFPDFRFVGLEDGLARVHREATGAA